MPVLIEQLIERSGLSYCFLFMFSGLEAASSATIRFEIGVAAVYVLSQHWRQLSTRLFLPQTEERKDRQHSALIQRPMRGSSRFVEMFHKIP